MATSGPPASSKIRTYKIGKYATEEYGIYFKNSSTLLSPFHDIPLYADEKERIFNMIVEIPKCTQHKLEISRNRALNPIVHDIKQGQIRVVGAKYPHNYGAFPQTWEKPSHVDPRTNCSGDNDPLDVVEIGCGVLEPGTIVPVKVLGIFALIDEGELDWKVVAVHIKDEFAINFNTLKDVEKQHPSLLSKMKDWFKYYKGQHKKNKIALNEEIKDQEFAFTVIEETHNFWKELIMSEDIQTDISRENICVEGSPFKKTLEEILRNFPEPLRDMFYKNLSSNSTSIC